MDSPQLPRRGAAALLNPPGVGWLSPGMDGTTKWLLVAGAVVALVLLWGLRAGASGKTVEAGRAAVAEGALLLDVRTPEEFAAGHVDGAVLIPVGELRERLAELGPKDRAVVLYCRSGRRSALAKSILEEAGHSTVIDVGPMPDW